MFVFPFASSSGLKLAIGRADRSSKPSARIQVECEASSSAVGTSELAAQDAKSAQKLGNCCELPIDLIRDAPAGSRGRQWRQIDCREFPHRALNLIERCRCGSRVEGRRIRFHPLAGAAIRRMLPVWRFVRWLGRIALGTTALADSVVAPARGIFFIHRRRRLNRAAANPGPEHGVKGKPDSRECANHDRILLPIAVAENSNAPFVWESAWKCGPESVSRGWNRCGLKRPSIAGIRIHELVGPESESSSESIRSPSSRFGRRATVTHVEAQRTRG